MIAISESQISAEVAAAAEVGLSHHAVQPVEDPEQPLSWIRPPATIVARIHSASSFAACRITSSRSPSFPPKCS